MSAALRDAIRAQGVEAAVRLIASALTDVAQVAPMACQAELWAAHDALLRLASAAQKEAA